MRTIHVGDEVYSYAHSLFACVEEVFPAAVCVKVGILSINGILRFDASPQLWRADDIENLSVCRYCGGRDALVMEHGTGVPFRICSSCLALPCEQRHPLPGSEWG
jgi:hypothetical protein